MIVFHSILGTSGVTKVAGASSRGPSGASDGRGMAPPPPPLQSGRAPCRAAPCHLCHQACGTALRAAAGHRAGSGGGNTRSGGGAGAQERAAKAADNRAALCRGRPEFQPDGDTQAAFMGVEDDDCVDEGEFFDEEAAEEGEAEEEDDDAAVLARSVVQVRTVHRVPNFGRPWEEGHDTESSSSGFVVAAEVQPAEPDLAAPGGAPMPRRQLLIMTTAGAVEHARKVEVCRAADDATPYPATVAAVCLDLDVALLRVEHPGFWSQPEEEQQQEEEEEEAGGNAQRRGRGRGRGPRGRGRGVQADAGELEAELEGSGPGSGLVPLQLDRGLPHLRKPVVVAGFPLGGGSLCVTSGVVSRIEVIEYSHSGRALLALQVDAPLNNGGWGGPALCPASGRCVGMAFQKFASQTWMERYDEAAMEVYGGEGDDDGGGDGGGGGDGDEGDGGGGGGGHGQDYDEDAENIGYLVPAQLLQLVLDDYSRELSHRHASTSSSSTTTGTTTSSAPKRRGARAPRAAATAAAVAPAAPAAPPPLLYLDGRPRLGLRYQRMESPSLRRWLGVGPGESGILVTGVDPTGSAAGLVQVHDVLLAVGGRQVAHDGTTLLRPGQRVLFGHWAAVARVGDPLSVTVLRGGARLDLTLRLRGAGEPFLPVSLGPGRRPQFLVVGPLVFAAFSLPYWFELMAGQQAAAPDRAARRRLHSGLVPVLGALEWGLPAEDDGEEVVLLTEVLECGSAGTEEEEEEEEDEHGEEEAPEEVGGGGRRGGDVASEAAAWSQLLPSPGRLATVNGARVRNLAHLAAAVVRAASSSNGSDERFLRLCLEASAANHQNKADGDDGGSSRSDASSSSSSDSGSSGGGGGGPGVSVSGRLVVLDASRLAADTRAVLRHHSMAAAMSAELRRRLSTNWPFEGTHAAQGASRQRRQQGRRVALSGRR